MGGYDTDWAGRLGDGGSRWAEKALLIGSVSLVVAIFILCAATVFSFSRPLSGWVLLPYLLHSDNANSVMIIMLAKVVVEDGNDDDDGLGFITIIQEINFGFIFQLLLLLLFWVLGKL